MIRNETKEGQTYESGVDIGPGGDQPDIAAIPDIPVDSPVIPVHVPNIDGAAGQPTIVVFDLETTGFGK